MTTLKQALLDKGITHREIDLFLNRKCLHINDSLVTDSLTVLTNKCTVSIVTKNHHSSYMWDPSISEHLFVTPEMKNSFKLRCQ